MTPTSREGNLGVKSVKLMHFFKKNSLLRDIVQTNHVYSNDDQGRVDIVMMTKEGSPKLVNFMGRFYGQEFLC